MTSDPGPVRTYGGWRRRRGIGLLGLGPAATFILLGVLVILLVIAVLSARTLLYALPAAALAAAAALIRPGGTPIAGILLHRIRWQYATMTGQNGYLAGAVQQHAGILQLPGTLAATELLSAEDGYGRWYGLVRDRRTGCLTATLRVVPTSTWLAATSDADSWVANWGAWLASLGYVPAVRWVSVTIDTAPDPGSALADHIAAATDPQAPRPARDILAQLVATAPAAAADVDTRVSITFDPAAYPSTPRTVAAAVAETGQSLAGLESALSSCGLTLLGRARAIDLAGAVRIAFDPAVRGEVSRLLASQVSPALETQLDWAAAGPEAALEQWDRYRHDSGISVSWTWRDARGRTSAATSWPAWSPPARSRNGSPSSTGRSLLPLPPTCWTARSGQRSSAASTPAAPAATRPPATPMTMPAPARPPTRKHAAPASASSASM